MKENMLGGIRKTKGITLKEMSKKIGVSAMYLSEIERGIKSASHDVGKKISMEYGIRYVSAKEFKDICSKACAGLPVRAIESGVVKDMFQWFYLDLKVIMELFIDYKVDTIEQAYEQYKQKYGDSLELENTIFKKLFGMGILQMAKELITEASK